MRETYGLIMFSFGFIGLILTYYLSHITGQLANQTGSYPPSHWIALIFYIISFALIGGGVLNNLQKRQ
jgi:hypothetical protein